MEELCVKRRELNLNYFYMSKWLLQQKTEKLSCYSVCSQIKLLPVLFSPVWKVSGIFIALVRCKGSKFSHWMHPQLGCHHEIYMHMLQLALQKSRSQTWFSQFCKFKIGEKEQKKKSRSRQQNSLQHPLRALFFQHVRVSNSFGYFWILFSDDLQLRQRKTTRRRLPVCERCCQYQPSLFFLSSDYNYYLFMVLK